MLLSAIPSIFQSVLNLSGLSLIGARVCGVFSLDSLIPLWIALELNMASFILFIYRGRTAKVKLSNYFVAQRAGSLLFMLASLSAVGAKFSYLSILFARGGLILKIGLVPFQLWFIRFIDGLEPKGILLLLTLQKMGPIYLILKWSPNLAGGLIVANRAAGVIGMVAQKKRDLFLGYFSLIRAAWMVARGAKVGLLALYAGATAAGAAIWLFRGGRGPGALGWRGASKSGRRYRALLTAAVLALRGLPPILSFYVKILLRLQAVKRGTIFGAAFIVFLTPLVLFSLLKVALRS